MSLDGVLTRIALARPAGAFALARTILVCAAVGVGLRLVLGPVLGGFPAYVLLVPPVAVAALWAGRAAGFWTALACLGGNWAIAANAPGLVPFDLTSNAVGALAYLIVAAFMTIFSASLGASLRDVDQAEALRRMAEGRIDRSESGLWRSEARFRSAVDAVQGVLWTNTADGRMDGEQPGWAALTGQTYDQYKDYGWASVVHPDDAQPTIDAWNAAVAGRRLFEFEHRLRTVDGLYRIFAIRAVPTLDAAGEVVEWVGVHTDVSAERAAETSLRESEARFRLMADTAPSPVWMTNAEAEVEFVNAALVEYFGRPAQEILGHVWKLAIHPDDQAAVEAAMGAARPQRLPYGFEARFRHADGGWRWMRISVNPRFEGDQTFLGYVGMAFDVTETREALVVLAAQERRQTFLLGLSDRLRELTTPDDIIAEVNRSVSTEIAADWASYGEVDEALETIAIRAAATRSARAGVTAVWRLEDFGPRLVAGLKRGQMARVDDITAHPDTAAVAQAFKDIEAGAVLGAPVLSNGRMRALFLIHTTGPHVWTDEEAALVEDVAVRAYAEVERARAVAGVRETNARLAAAGAERDAILGQLAEGVIVTDPQGAITFVNDAARRQHGVARLDITPGDYSDAYQLFTDDGRPYPPEDLPLARAVLGGQTVTDARWRIRRPDGTEVIAVGNARPVTGPDGVRIGAVLTLRDETARINAEHHLIESEARFRTVADSAPVFIWMTDPDTRIIFANHRYQTVFGTDTGELMGARWKKLAHPDDVEPFSLAFLNAMKTNDRFEAFLRIDHPDLGLRWLRCESIPRFDAAGVFLGYVGASIDVTDAKQAEEDLKRINELLEERVGEALAEKAKAEADLMHAQRMEAVGRLTGGVAHDFNNLLTVVIGALDMILRSPDDAARRKKLGEAALSAARRGERLTHQLLAFSRRQALRPEPVDLNAQISECEPLLRRAVGEAIEFRLKLRRGGARVSVDPAQFEAALLNLIVNARDAVAGKVGKSVGRIAVQTQSCDVAPGDVLELAPGDYICITVSDNGTGMDPATLHRVFEPFFTTKAVGKGTGLGLSQVYGFARQSGGGVHISSTPGRGSEIRLYLPPLDVAEPIAPDAPRVEVEAIPAGRRLLLVEDDAGVAAVAMELLQGLGLEVDAVESGPEALQALTGARFDVMLTDVVMPGGMTGIELARVCAERHPDVRILLTSGYAGEDVDEALADAPWPFLRKPYSADQLRQALGELLPLQSHP